MSEMEDAPVPANDKSPEQDQEWQRDLLNRLAFASLNEQRRARRWSVLFKSLLFLYLLALFVVYRPGGWDAPQVKKGKHTALVELEGVIAPGTEANADRIVEGLRDAFEDKNTAGVILRINSPGGSPVQSGYINDEIRRLRDLHPDKKLYAVISDVCASGGYYIAAAADEIYANKASIVGSVGVIASSFGFVDAMEKMGIERRVLTSGEHKALMDPFSPEDEVATAHMQTLLDEIHEQFIDVVKQGRGEKLQYHPDLFSGLIWSGEQSLELGLIDGLGSAGYVARELIGEEEIIDFTPRPDFLERFSKQLGASIGSALGQWGSVRLGE